MSKHTHILCAIITLVLMIVSGIRLVPANASREPIKGIIKQTHTFLCNSTYLLEINIAYYMIWALGYSNSINISIRSLDPLPYTRVNANLIIDKLSISKFLGYLEPQGTLNSLINISLAPLFFQIQGGSRELRQAQLNLLFVEPRCSFTIPIWFILAAFNVSLKTSVWIDPETVEVNSSTFIYIELKNQTPEPLLDVELYVYVNKSLVDSMRIDTLDDAKSKIIEYVPIKIGVYVVEVKTVYTSPFSVRQTNNATTFFIAKGRPSISLFANTTHTSVGKAVLITGSIEPRTGDPKIVRFEVSTDGMNWGEIGKLESTYSFSYTWSPTLPNVYYIRARVLETNLFYSALSNIVMVAVEKIKPALSINVDWPYVEVGSKILIKIDLSPPIIDTVEVLYKLSNESNWSKVTRRINPGASSIEITLTKPGVYEVKVVIPESVSTYSVESNILQLYVSNPKTANTSTKQLETLQIPYRTNYITLALIAIAVAIALVLLLLKKK